MASWLILFVGLIYLYTGADLIYNNQYGLGLTFIAYAIANVGLYMVARGL